MKKIVIVEDDKILSGELKILLENNGYEACQVFDFAHTVNIVEKEKPDLVLLDLMLPGISGQAILKEIRQKGDIPVIVVTSKNTDADEIVSMVYGADDYITKPYNPTLLLLRMEVLLKRTGKKSEVHTYRNLTINLLRSSIEINSEEIILSKNEITILYFLMQNQGRIVSRDELMDYLWDYSDFVDDNTLTVNINRLRRRLSQAGLEDVIQTRRKQGYLLV